MIVGIGTDLVSIERFQRSLEKFEGKLRDRMFTETERAYCDSQSESAAAYAVRFAAKEAAMKALGLGLSEGITWQDVEVVRTDNGKPELRFFGVFCKKADELGVTASHVSLSHTADSAVAFVILEKL